jgi:hypothetical protein
LPPSTSAPLFNYDEPPSPESQENPVESGAPPPDSSPAKLHSSAGPQIIPSVDPKPTSVNPASSKGNRRTVGGWFRKVMTTRSHNRTPRQTPSDASPQSGIPSQTTLPNEKPSTMAPGRRQKRTVGRSTVKRKKKPAQKPAASNQPPKTTAHSEAGPAKVPDETKPASEPSGAPDNEEPSQPPKTAPRTEAGPANVPDETKPEPSGAHSNVERGAGGLSWYNVNLSLSFSLPMPSWICCVRADDSG